MREMILNHASIFASSIERGAELLRELAIGMAALVAAKCVESSLRSQVPLYELRGLNGGTLLEAIMRLRRSHVDEHRFLLRLTTKSPLLSDLGETVIDRFRSCEAVELSAEDGEPLVLCAHVHGVLISFPSVDNWDRDELEVEFSELLPNEEIVAVREKIDNIARSSHSGLILDRFRSALHSEISLANFWDYRNRAFPNLVFGPDTREHIAIVQPSTFTTIINRLVGLDKCAREWTEGPAPQWPCKVTPESQNVMNNEVLREARRFRSDAGQRELFEWHARFGSGGRIHLRFDPEIRVVEIGYIGGHLPL